MAPTAIAERGPNTIAANTIGRTETLTWVFEPIRTDLRSASTEKAPSRSTPGMEEIVSPTARSPSASANAAALRIPANTTMG